MKRQLEVRDHLCELFKNPYLDPIGFKREALMEFADKNTICYVKNSYTRKKKKGHRHMAYANIVDWYSIPLDEKNVKRHLFMHLRRMWNMMKTDLSGQNATVLRLLDKIEVALWILEDDEAIEYIRNPEKYNKSAITLMMWISDRYGFEEHRVSV